MIAPDTGSGLDKLQYEYTNVHFCDNWTASEVEIRTFNCVTINSENKERHGLQTRHLESHLVDIMTCFRNKVSSSVQGLLTVSVYGRGFTFPRHKT